MTVAFKQYVSSGSWFLKDVDDIEKNEYRELLPYAHYLRQAWVELKLDGVLCVDGRPVVYVCRSNRFTPDKKRECHHFVWNQGLVPLLMFLTPSQVEVHSAIRKPKPQIAGLFDCELPSFIETLDNAAEAVKRAVLSIETGEYFQERAGFFPTDETVDRCLIRNLAYARQQLSEAGMAPSDAHALLGRALFVSFLHERKFIKRNYFPAGTESLIDILNQSSVEKIKRLLYGEFFPRLKDEFNGTMFDAVLSDEERRIQKRHLDILRNFLSGDDMHSGQTVLPFKTYDFRFIPVEIISAIYEEFLEKAGPTSKRGTGAYYTPRHLAETTLHVALDGRYDETENWRVLDPACGSGIFLVGVFNLLAEQWRRSHKKNLEQTKAHALLRILQKQIRGVDVNPDACRIAAFSLYLALFEKLQPMDVEKFKEQIGQRPFLPPLVWRPEVQIDTPVIIQGDFLNDDLPLGGDFNLVIGNPPWVKRGKKQVALHFTQHTPALLQDGGMGCLLLPSAILVNQTGTLGGEWFRDVKVEKIVQLADFRHILFEAAHPCFIMRYVKSKPTLEHELKYETPKLNRFHRRTGVFVVEPDDQKIVTQRDVTEAALLDRLQSLWSRKFWGTSRDEAFLRRLDCYPSLEESAERLGWKHGVGFQPYYLGTTVKKHYPLSSDLSGCAYLDNDYKFPKLVLLEKDFTTLREGLEKLIHPRLRTRASTNCLRRKPDDSLFRAPMLIYSKGFSKFAFYPYKPGKTNVVYFQDSLRSIAGRPEHADLLRFLTAVMGSRLMQYLTFHSGSSIGVERPQIYSYESLNVPFPLPDDNLAQSSAKWIVHNAARIVEHVENCTSENRNQCVSQAREQLEPLVEKYFSLSESEKILVDDTLKFFKKSIHADRPDKDVPTLKPPDRLEREGYAMKLCEVLNKRARKKGISIRAEGMYSKDLRLVLMTIIFSDRPLPYKETGGDQELWRALAKLDKAARRESGQFSYLRGFQYFENDRLFILKPATMRNWCRSVALNDADAIFDYLVSGGA